MLIKQWNCFLAVENRFLLDKQNSGILVEDRMGREGKKYRNQNAVISITVHFRKHIYPWIEEGEINRHPLHFESWIMKGAFQDAVFNDASNQVPLSYSISLSSFLSVSRPPLSSGWWGRKENEPQKTPFPKAPLRSAARAISLRLHLQASPPFVLNRPCS